VHAPAPESAAVHLEGSPVGDARVVDPARVAPARRHVEDPHDHAVAVGERDRERDQRVLHPEAAVRVRREDEEHAPGRRERAPAHEADLLLLRAIRDLDPDGHGADARVDDDPSVVERREPGRGGDRQEEQYEGHEPAHENILPVQVLGIDVGGTFTDAVFLSDDGIQAAKVPTAANQGESVVAAARAVGAAGVDRFTHGTTVATNALLERKGARTAFVATAGFEHLLHLGRQTRAHLYRLCEPNPEPLVPLERCVGVRERIGPDGVLQPLDLTTLAEIDAEAVAVCLLFAFRDPSHERAVVAELRSRLPGAHVVASHEVAPEFREFERASTTAVDAYLGPVASRYLHALADGCAAAGLPEPLVMRSSGGVASVREAAGHPSWILVSGPAGGVVGASLVARRAGFDNAVSFDMGGTSTDVCLIAGGSAERSAERRVGGFPVRLPMVDIHTVGAGGGSIARFDAGGALRVGPESAGAIPGPACYGKGGMMPTVTDANLLLGRLPVLLPGGIELDRGAAESALDGIDPAAVVAVVNAEMTRALRVVSIERGHDPRDFALVAFGGAGPLHACALAEELGIGTVLVPETAGVLSALGLVASEERRDHVRSYLVPLEEAGELPAEGEADLRYAGQSFELTVPLGPGLAAAFHAAHEERYGYADRDRRIELVAVRTADVRSGPPIALPASEPLDVQGPAVVELAGATCWVPPGWVGVRDGSSTLTLTRS
jgi:N-methylhydantoinase A